MRPTSSTPPEDEGNVSIHASVKDATVTAVNTAIVDEVSIHASVKDATLSHNPYFLNKKFQSTHL